MPIPDYLFYRFAKWFYKEDGPHGTRAIIVVAVFSVFVFWTINYLCFCFSMGGTLAGDAWMQKKQANNFVLCYDVMGSHLFLCLPPLPK